MSCVFIPLSVECVPLFCNMQVHIQPLVRVFFHFIMFNVLMCTALSVNINKYLHSMLMFYFHKLSRISIFYEIAFSPVNCFLVVYFLLNKKFS